MSINSQGIIPQGCPREKTKPAHGNSRQDIARSYSPKVKIGKESLRNLSDKDLLAQLEKTRGAERAAECGMVLYLAEVERRRLYLPRGYGSLFEFCTDHLKYSRSSAGRRISAARCIARFPRMAELFRRGECDLTVLSAIAGIVTAENSAEIASWLKGRSLREIEAYVAMWHPERRLRDQVRQIFVMSKKPDGAVPELTAADVADADADGGSKCKASFTFTPSAGSKTVQSVYNKSDKNREVPAGAAGGSGNSAPSDGNGAFGAAHAGRVVVERKFKIQFAVEPRFMEMLERVQSIVPAKHAQRPGFEAVFTMLMEYYLDRNDPESRIEKRKQRAERKSKSAKQKNGEEIDRTGMGKRGTAVRSRAGRAGTVPPEPRDDKTAGKKRRSTKETRHLRQTARDEMSAGKGARCKSRNRHIPQAIRDEVYVRDGGRCSFISTNGRRCGETRNLEVDHIIPYAKGGPGTPDNLRLLCFKHNQLEAEWEYGKNLMKKYHRKE